MSVNQTPYTGTQGWRRAYRTALLLLPRALRDKHGEAMEALFVRGLENAHSEGTVARWRAGLSALFDVVRRGVYERALDERAAWHQGGAGNMRRVAGMYALSLFVLTDVMLAVHAYRQWPRWQAEGVSAAAVGEMVLLAVPFTAALTIPMAVFVAVLLAGRHRTRTTSKLRPLPLVLLFGALSGGALLWNAEVVPRANARIVRLQHGESVAHENDRSLTLSALRQRSAQLNADLAATTRRSRATAQDQATVGRLAEYEVEIHKKFAIAAACLVFAVLALALLRAIPALGAAGTAGMSLLVFGGYYTALMAGETAADRQLVSGAAGMWAANGLLMLVAAVTWLRAGRQTIAVANPVAECSNPA